MQETPVPTLARLGGQHRAGKAVGAEGQPASMRQELQSSHS